MCMYTIQEVLCFSCATAARRSRKRGAVEDSSDAPSTKTPSTNAHIANADVTSTNTTTIDADAGASVAIISVYPSTDVPVVYSASLFQSRPAPAALSAVGVSGPSISSKETGNSELEAPRTSAATGTSSCEVDCANDDSDYYFHLPPSASQEPQVLSAAAVAVHVAPAVRDDHTCTLHDHNTAAYANSLQSFPSIAKVSIPTKPQPLSVSKPITGTDATSSI